MRYYKQISESNTLVSIGTGFGGIEITETEYNELSLMIREKTRLVNSIYNGEAILTDVPTEWQEEIQRRVDERKAMEEELKKNAENTDKNFIKSDK